MRPTKLSLEQNILIMKELNSIQYKHLIMNETIRRGNYLKKGKQCLHCK